MLYYSYLALGISELGPKNRAEYLFCVAYMIISAFTFSHVFGQISGLYNLLVANQIASQNELDSINFILYNFNLNDESKKNIRSYQ